MHKNLANAKSKVKCKLTPLNVFLLNLEISFTKIF